MKLFVADLDGTLLNEDNRVSEKSKEALKQLEQAGYIICLASGRVLSSVESIIQEAGVKALAIGNNGAIMSDEQRNIIYKNSIKKEVLKDIVTYLIDDDLVFHMYDNNTFYSNKLIKERVNHMVNPDGEDHVKYHIDKDISNYIEENNTDIYKINLQLDLKNNNEIKSKLESFRDIDAIMSGKDCTDVMAKDINKWDAINFYLKNSNKDIEKIVCIGDYDNDITIVENADVGIAMENGTSELKEVADYITSSNTDEGFSKAVDYILEK